MLFDGRAGPVGGGQGDRAAVEGDSVRAARGEDQEARQTCFKANYKKRRLLALEAGEAPRNHKS